MSSGHSRDGRQQGGAQKKAPARDESERVVFPFPSAELLEKGLGMLGLPVEDSLLNTLYRPVGIEPTTDVRIRGSRSIILLVNRYIRELELFNAVFDLVGAETGSEQGKSDLVVRHILDSLAPWKEIAALAAGQRPSVLPVPQTIEIADVGSGAGFPGIPLSLVFPDVHFTLVERMSKRCAFLENCVAVLGLKNVTVLNSEVENATVSCFDIVVFRAFRPLDREMTKSLLRLARAGSDAIPAGKLAAWKARRDKIETEMNAIAEELDGWRAVATPVPFLDHEERHVVITSSAQIRCQRR